MTMLNRVLLAAGLSWVYSVTLGLLFAASTSGRLSFSTLRLPGVVPVGLITSTIIALVMTPIAAWRVAHLCAFAKVGTEGVSSHILLPFTMLPSSCAHRP